MAHQVTVKGQVTIPKRVREYLGIRPGSGVEFEIDPKGDVLLRKAGRTSKRVPSRFAALRGTRKSGMSTDEIMNLLRGYDEDARDPGFKSRRNDPGRRLRRHRCAGRRSQMGGLVAGATRDLERARPAADQRGDLRRAGRLRRQQGVA